MSHVLHNGTSLFADTWSGYLAQAQAMSNSRLILLALVNVPVIIILLNVLWQLVRLENSHKLVLFFNSPPFKVAPRDKSKPPLVFHWVPIIGSAISYGNDPLNFFFACREKVR